MYVVAKLHRYTPDSKIHGANVGPTWGRQDPGEHHVGHMNFAILAQITIYTCVAIDMTLCAA